MSVVFETSSTGRLLSASAGLAMGMTACSAGTSHMTGTNGLGYIFQYCKARYHNADMYFDSRQVLTSVADATVLANRGASYATPTAGSSHMVGAQLTQFNTDIAAGIRYNVLFIDGGVYNDAPTTQANLDTAVTRTQTFLDAFFDPAGNNGSVAIVWGYFGVNPTLSKSWANYWRFKELTSNGRIRFVDAMSVLIDPAASTATSWAWKGGTSALGATTADSTHVSSNGARLVAPLLYAVLKDVCPRVLNWPGGMPTSDYDPANMRWGDLLGVGAAMQGTGGIDMVTGGGTFSGDIPGKATGGLKDKWQVSWSGLSVKPTFAIAANAAGDREFTMGLSGNSTAGAFLRISYQPTITNLTNSVSTRRHIMGIVSELVGVTGLNEAYMRANGVSSFDTPTCNSSGGQQDGLPDTTSETWNYCSPYPVAWSGNDPIWDMFFQFRAKTGIAGSIKVRKPFLCLERE